VTSVSDITKDTLLAYVESFPDFDALHPFYAELTATLVNVRGVRADLRRLQKCAELVTSVCKKNMRQMNKTSKVEFLEMKRKEVYGRVGSILNETGPALERLEGARHALVQVPSLDLTIPTVVVAGLPNVGKSAFVARIASAKPRIAPYPFTTRGIIVGHAELGGRRVQVVDTPGILDRPAEERNEIEERALAAVRHLGDVVVFLFDPTAHAHAPMEAQEHLLKEVRQLFRKRLIVEVENKADLVRTKSRRLKMSAETGEGVDALLAHVVRLLPTNRGRPAWAEEEE
jgi:nucleolar GTP-binding protein